MKLWQRGERSALAAQEMASANATVNATVLTLNHRE
jgi:hypothetical protein